MGPLSIPLTWIASRRAPHISEHATSWTDQGVPVVPLQVGSKIPAIGFSSRAAITDTETAVQYFQQNPLANYGVLTGEASEIVILDVDGQRGLQSYNELKAKVPGFKKTGKVISGRGFHLYFCDPEGSIKTSHGKLGPGLDVIGCGGYVVGPGSIHTSGKIYTVEKGKFIIRDELADITWLRNCIALYKADSVLGSDKQSTLNLPGTGEGSRNNSLTSYLGAFVRQGIGEEELNAIARGKNASYDPPLPEDEVTKIVRSLLRYPPVNRDADPGEEYARLVLASEYADGANLIRLADGSFWSFCGTHWRDEPLDRLKNRVLKVIESSDQRPSRTATSALINQTIELIKAKCAPLEEDPLRFIQKPAPVINLRSGELWLKSDGSCELKAHSAGSYLRHYLDIEFDPSATSPMFDKALSEIFPNETSDLIPYIHEVFGYVLQPERPIALIMLWLGTGSNGKSGLASVLTHLVGRQNVTAMRVGELGRNQFSAANLFGALLFVDDDVSAGTSLPDGELKRISEEKILSAERKFGGRFDFVNRAVPLLLCNSPPSVKDLSHGLQRRLQVVPFDTHFESDAQDRTLFQRIIQTELPGILNHALSGYTRVIANRWRFSEPKCLAKATAAYLAHANPVAAFLRDRCVRSNNGSVLVAEVYEAYQNYCTSMGITMTQQRGQFQRNLESLGIATKRTNRGVAFIGLGLSSFR